MDSREYRDAMARLTAAVTVVTTDGPKGRAGFTASAVCSVSDDPATLLVCMNRASSRHGHFRENGIACVNVLSGLQQRYSPLFAAPMDRSIGDCFPVAEWESLTTGAPVLRDATAVFDCRITHATDIGTHSVLFCLVVAVRLGPQRSGLAYFDRAYHPLLST